MDSHPATDLRVTRADSFHQNATVELFAAVQVDTEGRYPPSSRTAGLGGMGRWVHEHAVVVQFVGLGPEDQVRGTVSVSRVPTDAPMALPLLRAGLDPSDCLQIVRLAVHPNARRTGVGKRLLRAATDFIRAEGAQPVLGLLTTQAAARALYTAEGWEESGSYTGVSGRQLLTFAHQAPAA